MVSCPGLVLVSLHFVTLRPGSVQDTRNIVRNVSLHSELDRVVLFIVRVKLPISAYVHTRVSRHGEFTPASFGQETIVSIRVFESQDLQ